ncbi:TcpQ domain-containing protein [Rheinheimera texasensis]|uniref:TcpQ domain-containing protein n=1 Tax=Rheinheimera texasensis TaxID=306205 RepID=UPI0032B26D46
MGFWFKHIVALVFLLGLAAVLLFYPDLLLPKSEPAKVQIKTAAAMEFTNFYEQLRYSLDTSVDKSKEFIIKLNDTSDQLTTTLESRTNTVPEMPANWSGSKANRKFEPGSKVREHMINFARQEEMELYWTLPRDYVVKHYFQSEGDYLKTLKDIAKAIAPDFENPVRAYFCPKQRAAILTDKPNLFLEQNCQHLNAEEMKH